jgi:hypothetical protein
MIGVALVASGRGRAVAVTVDVGVEIGVRDAARGAGAGHKLQLDAQVPGALAHGRRGQRFFTGSAHDGRAL